MRKRVSDEGFPTLVALLRQQAQRYSEQIAFTFLEESARPASALTYGQLDERARAIGASLLANLAPGDRVLLLYPSGLEFIAAFFGCLYAGVVAVPSSPPRGDQRTSARLDGIVASARPSAILTTAAVRHALGISHLQTIGTDEIPTSFSTEWREPVLDSDSLAFLQYTSGSTSAPKGVMVTHGNLLHNSECIRRSFELTRESVSVSWLPTHHDMGLIDGIIQPVYGAFPAYLMAPMSFLKRPRRWLEAISIFRATHSGGPNFAYDLCVNRIAPDERRTLDLACWRSAYNGAEPVRAETMRRFTDAFASCGFRSRFFYPCYGLAEATLMVTGGSPADEPVQRALSSDQLDQHRALDAEGVEKTRLLVGCGRAPLDTRVAIVDPQSLMPCAPEQVGEVWVSGSSVALGYWLQPSETDATFRAFVVGGEGDPYLRTGDLGFLSDGELFITGRLKDVFIVRGRNHYPQDIEWTAEHSHHALRLGCGAAFTVSTAEGEELVLVQEVERAALRGLDLEEVAATVRRAVGDQHELQIRTVVLVRPGTIPKTSSGKIQRHSSRRGFLAGALDELGRSVVAHQNRAVECSALRGQDLSALPPIEQRSRLLEYLRLVVAEVLAIAPTWRPGTRLIELGLDSLGAAELKRRIETELNFSISVVSFLRDAAIEDVVDELLASSSLSRPDSAIAMQCLSPSNTDYPLSPGQGALWFLHQAAPESAAYNMSFAAQLLSPIDEQVFRSALMTVVDRHDALRTIVRVVDGRPSQRTLPRGTMDFEIVDTIAWSSADLHRFLREESQRPFDMEKGPLLRVRLCRREMGAHVLLLTAHHITIDLPSLAIVFEELGTIWCDFQHRNSTNLPPVVRQLADYARSQAEFVVSDVGQRQWDYWRTQLTGAPPVLQLPSDRPRGPTQTFEGAVIYSSWDDEVVARLRKVARIHGVTIYTLLLAVFQVQLYRHTGENDILVGTSVDGRSQTEFSGTVGYLVNQLVIRGRFDGNPSFSAFLAQTRQTVLDALENHKLPFPVIVERLKPARDASYSPLFQVMFLFQRLRLNGFAGVAAGVEGDPPELGELHIAPFPLAHHTSQFDVTLNIVEDSNCLTACWEYNCDLFNAETIEGMNSELKTLLAAIIDDPEQGVRNLPLMSAGGREQLVHVREAPVPRPPARACIHHLFEAQAVLTPDAVAILAGEERMTYRQLDACANNVAQELIACGVGPETLVAICVERSVAMVVALFGVLKAGGAYLPLDPLLPDERLRHLLHESKAAVLLAKTQLLLDRALFATSVRIVRLDRDWRTIAASESRAPHIEVGGHNLAYVLYTSGSTGFPKGSMITHLGLVNYLAWCVQEYRVAEGSGAPVNSPFAFDATITSLLSPLLVGRQVVLLPEADEMAALADALRAGQDFSLVKLTPSQLELLRSYLPMSHVGLGTRALIVGGEPFPPSLLAYWQTHAPGTRIVNEYGPTETVVGCCFHDATTHGTGTVPIGRPIANTEVWVLDGQLQPVPVGVVGELCVGGPGVARGYLGHPELTAERFVRHPLGTDPAARLYRTGDLVRRRVDGVLEYIGRADSQIKIRGYRIELAEIEAALLRHDCVRDAVVDVRLKNQNQCLVAYLVPEAGCEIPPETDLWRNLERTLPKYMVPSKFIWLDRLPLSPNGKIDRRALPAPDWDRARAPISFAPPRTEIEQDIAAVWRQVLGAETIGVDDNFFDLGGHSLLLARVHHLLRERLQRELSIVTLLQFPTVSSLAAHLVGMSNNTTDEFRPVQDRAGRRKRAFNGRQKGGK